MKCNDCGKKFYYKLKKDKKGHCITKGIKCPKCKSLNITISVQHIKDSDESISFCKVHI